ncbi:hypothetical protein ACXYTJ_00340 [Gilvimarinus sp. F26214L]|uniref:hypothetical protein n=1 Tax=Gilvimarinus sp. DZF01 TaxID=3461371 RepID=UPI004045D2D0
MSNPRKTDVSVANEELRTHVPLLIRWGVACLMVIATLAALAAQGEGDMNFLSVATFFVLWLGCLWKFGQSAFIVAAVFIERRQDSEPD